MWHTLWKSYKQSKKGSPTIVEKGSHLNSQIFLEIWLLGMFHLKLSRFFRSWAFQTKWNTPLNSNEQHFCMYCVTSVYFFMMFVSSIEGFPKFDIWFLACTFRTVALNTALISIARMLTLKPSFFCFSPPESHQLMKPRALMTALSKRSYVKYLRDWANWNAPKRWGIGNPVLFYLLFFLLGV